MYKLFITPNIKNWLDKNMEKYQTAPNAKHITNYYTATTKTNDNFKISVYTTGLITISGTLKNRIYQTLLNQIKEENITGYDEVGVGDFFGPTVYVSVHLTQESIQQLSNLYLPINDSKKLTTPEIFKIYNQTKNFIEFKTQIIFDSQINNLNSIAQKVTYHHQNIIHPQKTHIIDLFTTEKSFFKYSNDLNLKWPDKTILETKADSKYYCVALASIFARAIFLTQMDTLNSKYNINFPLGATNVKPTAKKFIDTYGKEELATFCKTSFKTFNEI